MAETEEAEESSAEPEVLTVQAVCDLLQSPRRRHTVRVLADQPRDVPVPLQELAAAVARREAGSDEVDDQARKNMYVSLYQTHLLELDRYGVVTVRFDDDEGPLGVYPHRRVRRLAKVLTCIERHVEADQAGSRWPGSTVVSTVINRFRRRRLNLW